jgi:hypothetical protein
MNSRHLVVDVPVDFCSHVSWSQRSSIGQGLRLFFNNDFIFDHNPRGGSVTVPEHLTRANAARSRATAPPPCRPTGSPIGRPIARLKIARLKPMIHADART